MHKKYFLRSYTRMALALLAYLLITSCATYGDIDAVHESAKATLADISHRLYNEGWITELMQFAATGDLEKLRNTLDSGVDPNQVTQYGYSAVMFAAEHGNLSATKMLVDHGADLELRTASGYTALFVAGYGNDSFESFMDLRGWSYVGEHDQSGVINYLISMNAPIYESLNQERNAEHTGLAFYAIAKAHEAAGTHTEAREAYEIAMNGFVQLPELKAETQARNARIDRSLTVGRAIQPTLEAASQRYQAHQTARQLGDVSALRQAEQQNLDQGQTLELVGETRQRLENQGNAMAVGDAVANPTPNTGLSSGGANASMVYSNELLNDFGLVLDQANRERAIAIGIMLQCYDNETSREAQIDCLKWATTEYDKVDIAVTKWAKEHMRKQT